VISGAEKIEVDCARRSPPSAPLDAGSIPAISTNATGDVCPRKARAASPSSFLLGCASRGGGSATRTPSGGFAPSAPSVRAPPPAPPLRGLRLQRPRRLRVLGVVVRWRVRGLLRPLPSGSATARTHWWRLARAVRGPDFGWAVAPPLSLRVRALGSLRVGRGFAVVVLSGFLSPDDASSCARLRRGLGPRQVPCGGPVQRA